MQHSGSTGKSADSEVLALHHLKYTLLNEIIEDRVLAEGLRVFGV